MGIYKNMSNLLKEKEMGNFKLEKFEINDRNRGFRCTVPNGKYIRLFDTSINDCVMSNTKMEERTNMNFVTKAHGNILVAGLGIGMIILPIQDNEDVKSITIVEKNEEVIELILSQLKFNSKVNVIHDDIFNYKPPRGTKFDVIYFDIWNYVNQDIYEEMKELKRKYKNYLRPKKENPNRFMKCWAEHEAKSNNRLK